MEEMAHKMKEVEWQLEERKEAEQKIEEYVGQLTERNEKLNR